MKKTNLFATLFVVLAAHLLALVVALFFFVPSALLAQAADAVAPVVTLTVPASAPAFYATGEFWSALFGLVAGIVAIWRNQTASAHQKVNESLVLAIEQVTKLPEVAAAEQRIKQAIQAKATALGVQPLLHRIVVDLTEPQPTRDPALPAERS